MRNNMESLKGEIYWKSSDMNAPLVSCRDWRLLKYSRGKVEVDDAS